MSASSLPLVQPRQSHSPSSASSSLVRQRSTRRNRSGSRCMCAHDPSDDGPSAWTPFSLPEAQPSTSQRHRRMIQTRRGDLYCRDEADDTLCSDILSTASPSPPSPSVSTTEGACSHCEGTGKQTCEYCRGVGRTNYLDKPMLPSGVWPMWCTKCIRCSGETVCGWCLGSGRAREPIGFRVQ
jgi:hypothetical protein